MTGQPAVGVPSREQLIAWWHSHDWDSLAPVLWRQALHMVPRHVVPATDDREDVAAIAVVRAWRSPMVPDDPLAWLNRVVHNLSFDAVKLKRDKRTDHGFLFDSLEHRGPLPDDCVRRDTLHRALSEVAAALDLLSPITRACVVRTQLLDESSIDIGRDLGLTDAAVRVRTTRGRRALAEHFADGALYHALHGSE